MWKPTKGLDGSPRADEVYWGDDILDRGVAEEKAEDVKGIMPVVGEGKWMHNSVEVYNGGHDEDNRNGNKRPRSWNTRVCLPHIHSSNRRKTAKQWRLYK